MTSTPETAALVRTAKRQRRTKTRERLLGAARALLAQRAREAFTIDDVVQTAGVSKGSFYNHFVDREAIVSAVYQSIHEREEREIAEANREVADPVLRIAHGMAIYARLALDAPDEARILVLSRFETMLDAALGGGLADDLRHGLKAGRLAVPSVETGAMLVVGQVAVLMTRLQRLEPLPARLMTQQVLGVALVGLGLEHREAQQAAAKAVEETMSALATAQPQRA